jgi:hypothetical protein
MFKRLFRSLTSAPLTVTEILERGRALPPAKRDIRKLMPIILPAEALDAGWPGPIVRIDRLPFALGWATLGEMNTFFYVTDAEAAYWAANGIDWRAVALDNLARLASTNPVSGQKLDADGRPFVQILLHDDAIGPSRLLIPKLFEDVFGGNYRVAIPERTCAVIYRTDLTPEQSADVDGMIGGCFKHGTEPMCPDRFDPQDFWHIADTRQ